MISVSEGPDELSENDYLSEVELSGSDCTRAHSHQVFAMSSFDVFRYLKQVASVEGFCAHFHADTSDATCNVTCFKGNAGCERALRDKKI